MRRLNLALNLAALNLALLLLAPAVLPAETVTGAWKCVVKLDGGATRPFKLDLVQKDTAVSGTASRSDGSTEIRKGSFEGGKLKFTVEADGSVYGMEATLSGDKLSGTVLAPDGMKIPWEGEREGAATTGASGIAGSWKLTAKDGERTHQLTLDIKQEGEVYKAKFTTSNGEIVDATNVTFSENKLKLRLPTGDGVYEVEGTLEGEKISGTYVHPSGRKDSWEAKRT